MHGGLVVVNTERRTSSLAAGPESGLVGGVHVMRRPLEATSTSHLGLTLHVKTFVPRIIVLMPRCLVGVGLLIP